MRTRLEPKRDGNPRALLLALYLASLLSARTLALQHRVPKSELWKGFSGAPTAAKAAVGYLALFNLWLRRRV
jgi:hypothetical protein